MAFVGASLFTARPGPASASLPGKNGKIAFASLRDGNAETYVTNAHGGNNPAGLTEDAANDHGPDRRQLTAETDVDTDLDGCTDFAEKQPKANATTGGGRDLEYFWDFYDVWTRPVGDPDGWERDKSISLFGDLLGVASRFGTHDDGGDATINRNSDPLIPPTDDTSYHPAFDRGMLVGPNPWDLGLPDGTMDLFIDIFGVARQFGHDCTAALTPTPTPSPTPTEQAHLLFGMGPEADAALSSRLVQEAPVGMLTTWYNGSADLDWKRQWASGCVEEGYPAGYAMHLVIYSGDPEDGTPCGRQYPISDSIEANMVELAQIFAGSETGPPLYVTLFTEFQTYPCQDNQWLGAEAYYVLLKQKMLSIRDIFHAHAPNAQVSIGWGGWQARWDDPASGAGRSLFGYFSDVMSAMDFQSFQAMQGDGNVADVEEMTGILGAYGPVMLAHYKPDGFHPDVFHADLSTMFTDQYLAEVNANGLFAWSFMDHQELSASEETYQLVKAAVERYGGEP